MDKLEQDWKQYHILIDLYKFYLSINTAVNTVILFIIGITSTYAIVKSSDGKELQVVLIFAFLISFISTFACIRFYKPSKELSREVNTLAKELNLRLAPHTFILPWILQCLLVLYLFISAGLLIAVFILFPN